MNPDQDNGSSEDSPTYSPGGGNSERYFTGSEDFNDEDMQEGGEAKLRSPKVENMIVQSPGRRFGLFNDPHAQYVQPRRPMSRTPGRVEGNVGENLNPNSNSNPNPNLISNPNVRSPGVIGLIRSEGSSGTVSIPFRSGPYFDIKRAVASLNLDVERLPPITTSFRSTNFEVGESSNPRRAETRSEPSGNLFHTLGIEDWTAITFSTTSMSWIPEGAETGLLQDVTRQRVRAPLPTQLPDPSQ